MAATAQMINSPEHCVDDMLIGLCSANPGLCVDLEKRVVSIREHAYKGVTLISGGGSGHEPFAAGYVGRGMLSAAVAGSVFASPPSDHVLAAILKVATPAGVLAIIANYTGDALNFGIAIEKARIKGIRVKGLVVGEDCALDELESGAGRRGMGGLLFVYKISGRLAELGTPLCAVITTAREVQDSMATIGVGLRACRLPGQPEPLFQVADGKMELGLGVHGEAGLSSVSTCSAADTVALMIEKLKNRLNLSPGDPIAVLVNNLGSLSQLEQWVVAAEVDRQLTELGASIVRMYVGHIMTSLDMDGFQVSVLKLPESKKRDWLEYLDAPTDAPGWPGCTLSVSTLPRQQYCLLETKKTETLKPTAAAKDGDMDVTQQCLLKAAQAVSDNEEKLNQLDSGCGDGDCGSTLKRLAEAIASNISSFAGLSKRDLLEKLADMSEEEMGGTSGAVYSLIFTTGAAKAEEGDWLETWRAGLEGVMRYSLARVGDRTLMDALIPACDAYEAQPRSTSAQCVSALGSALAAAQAGCEATRNMKARFGRASYVRADLVKDVDAGAFGVCVWMEAIHQELLRLTGGR